MSLSTEVLLGKTQVVLAGEKVILDLPFKLKFVTKFSKPKLSSFANIMMYNFKIAEIDIVRSIMCL